MYVCSCFGVTEAQVEQHARDGACTPRRIASACKAGTDCGSCVRRIQAVLGRGASPRRDAAGEGRPVLAPLGRESGTGPGEAARGLSSGSGSRGPAVPDPASAS